jgi:hypothetical protein
MGWRKEENLRGTIMIIQWRGMVDRLRRERRERGGGGG